MLKSSNQKLKTLYLMKILLEKTDEDNTITLYEMIAELEKVGISLSANLSMMILLLFVTMGWILPHAKQKLLTTI